MGRLVVAATIAALAVVIGSPAHAAAPIRTTSQIDAVIPFPDVCDFPLTAHVVGTGHMLTFVDASGAPVGGFLGGQLFVTWTRVDTGFSRRFTISGPTFFDADGNAVRGTGSWTTPMVEVGWVLAHGNLTFDGTQDGFSLISSVRGSWTSICDLMS
jgi:hypothetical protein